MDDCNGTRLADAVQCCYRLVTAVHKVWRQIDGEFDDYIANPKPSGYQALHTAVWGPGGAALEVQIKTSGMHEHAEYGGAAHWAYKEVSTVTEGLVGGELELPLVTATAAGMGLIHTSSSSSSSTHGGVAGGTATTTATAAAVTAAAVLAFDGMGPHDGKGSSSSNSRGSSSNSSSSSGGWGSSHVQYLPPVMYTFDVDSYGEESGAQNAVTAAAAAGPAAAAGTAQNPFRAPDVKSPFPQSSSSSSDSSKKRVSGSSSRTAAPPAPAAAVLPKIYPGQPVLRVGDGLRYGVVLSCDSSSGSTTTSSTPPGSSRGPTLTVVIMNGGTSQEHPLRVPDYGFYGCLREYAVDHKWDRAGHGDFRARTEDYVYCRDGRYHRRDHMGYVHPNTTLTLLEGYEGEARSWAAADATAAAAVAVAGASPGGNFVTANGATAAAAAMVTIAGGRGSQEGVGKLHADGATASRHQQQQQQAAAAATKRHSNSNSSSRSGGGSGGKNTLQSARSSKGVAAGKLKQQQQPSSSSAAAVVTDPSRRQQLMQQWQETAAKAAQLRSIIEWGAAAYGQQGEIGGVAGGTTAPIVEALQTGDVSVLIWPGGKIEEVPRGTTAGQILKERGVLAIVDGGGNAAGGQEGGMAGVEGGRGSTLVNVNNQLVDESTVLSDGDLVILAREKLKI